MTTTLENFDPDKFYLGTLCKRGHDYHGTGKSLRYKTGQNCLKCNRIKNRKFAQRPDVKARAQEYRQRPEIRARKREYARRPETKARNREYHHIARIELRDRYIKKRIWNMAQIPAAEIPRELIEAKRKAIFAQRQINKIKKGGDYGTD